MKTNKLFFSGITLGLSIASIMGLASIFKTKQYIAPFEIKENVEATDEVFSKDKPSIIGGYIGEKNLINKRLKNEEDNLTKPKIGYQMAYGTKDDGTKTVSIRYTAAISSLDVDSATWTRAMYEENGDAYSRLKEASKEVTTAYTGLTNNGKVTYATSVEDDLGNKPFNYYVVYTLLEIPLESYGTYYLDASLTITKNGKSITSTVGAVEINNQNMFSYERGSNDYINYELDTGSKTYNVSGNQNKKSTPIEELVIPGYYNNGQGRYKVNNIKDNAFDGFDDVDYFDIPDVEYMGSGVFYNSKGKLLCRGNKKHDNWKDDWNSNNNSTSWNYIGIYGVKDNIVYTICRDVNRSIYSTAIGYTSNLLDKATISSFLLIPTREIGDYCFYGKESLKEVTIPNTVKRVGISAFRGTLLETINDGENIEKVDDYAFFRTKISYLPFEKNVVNISKYAFADCENIKEIYFEKVERIEEFAFCSTIVFYIPNTIKYIGGRLANYVLFEDSEEELNNKGIDTIDTKIFYYYNCNNLKEFKYKIFNSIKYLIVERNNEKEAILIDGSNAVGDVILPNEIDSIAVTKIGARAFENNNNLKSIVLSSNIKTIGNQSFSGCINLESIDLKYVKEIDGPAFSETYSLKEINLPDTIETITNSMLSNMYIEELVIPNSIKYIANNAFSWNTKLKKVYIPKSVTNIDWHAFNECGNIAIYCEAESKPEGWDDDWNNSYPVVWGCKSLPTD